MWIKTPLGSIINLDYVRSVCLSHNNPKQVIMDFANIDECFREFNFKSELEAKRFIDQIWVLLPTPKHQLVEESNEVTPSE